jgi:PIN domain nuclease of toxin-antitoxin system
MIYLLDTHYLLWSLFAPEKIADPIRRILEDEQNTKLFSGVNLWEISFKYSLGKLELGGTNPSKLFDTLLDAGFDVVPVDNHLLASYYQLPRKDDHKDPFARLLIWQAITNDYTLLTQDKKVAQYEADGLAVIVG